MKMFTITFLCMNLCKQDITGNENLIVDRTQRGQVMTNSKIASELLYLLSLTIGQANRKTGTLDEDGEFKNDL